MHGDKKVGLALGVLLVGVVGAFFFRNEPNQTMEAPSLEDPQTLDKQISARPGSIPYLTDDIETDESSEPTQQKKLGPRPQQRPFDVPDFVKGGGTAAGVPDPIQPLTPHRGNTESSPIPSHNKAWDPVVRPGPPSLDALPVTAPGGLRVHEVQPGETLSGLASRYLGSSARFLEIYTANRDLLKSPDDLRVGMTIRIPDRRASTLPGDADGQTGSGAERQTDADRVVPARPTGVSGVERSEPPDVGVLGVRSRSTPARPAAAQDPSNDRARADSPKPSARKFVPARRPPLSPRGNVDATSQSDRQSTSTPKRSHVPSIDVVDVEEGRTPNTKTAGETARTAKVSDQSKPVPRNYTVRRGDSLEKIALRVYGKRSAAEKIFAANRKRLKKPGALPAGMTIVLP